MQWVERSNRYHGDVWQLDRLNSLDRLGVVSACSISASSVLWRTWFPLVVAGSSDVSSLRPEFCSSSNSVSVVSRHAKSLLKVSTFLCEKDLDFLMSPTDLIRQYNHPRLLRCSSKFRIEDHFPLVLIACRKSYNASANDLRCLWWFGFYEKTTVSSLLAAKLISDLVVSIVHAAVELFSQRMDQFNIFWVVTRNVADHS